MSVMKNYIPLMVEVETWPVGAGLRVTNRLPVVVEMWTWRAEVLVTSPNVLSAVSPLQLCFVRYRTHSRLQLLLLMVMTFRVMMNWLLASLPPRPMLMVLPTPSMSSFVAA